MPIVGSYCITHLFLPTYDGAYFHGILPAVLCLRCFAYGVLAYLVMLAVSSKWAESVGRKAPRCVEMFT